MIAESIQGVGGVVQFTKGYIEQAAQITRDNGGLFISDEVQTGFGRTGHHFWGYQSHHIVPDIVTMAKGIGNGFPLAAVVTTPKIAKVLERASHFNTYGGNPMACAVGMAVLEVIEKEELQKNALDVGTYFLKSLDQLRDTVKIIGDVRGQVNNEPNAKLKTYFEQTTCFGYFFVIFQGLMIGVELVESKESRKPLAKELFQRIWNETKERGVLFGNGGINGNVWSLIYLFIIHAGCGEIFSTVFFLFRSFSDTSNKATYVHQQERCGCCGRYTRSVYQDRSIGSLLKKKCDFKRSNYEWKTRTL